MTRHRTLFLLVLLFLCFGSCLPAQARTFDLLIPIEEHCMAPLTTAEDLDAFAGLVAADPTVTFKTLGGPTWEDCGRFDWKIQWFLTPTPLANETWIVQHVVATYNVMDCDGTKQNLTNWDYYEAWRMGTNGQAEPKYNYDFKGDGTQSTVDYSANAPTDDEFFRLGRGDTKGSWTIDADAAYQATIKAGEFAPNAVLPAGGLPATTTKPTNLGTTSMHRHVEASWDCCAATTTTTGSASANNPDNTYTESWGWDGTTLTHKLNGKVVAMPVPTPTPTPTTTPAPTPAPVPTATPALSTLAALPVPTIDTPLSALAALVHSSPAWDGTTFDPGQLISVANQLQAMGRDRALQALHAYRDELANAPGEHVMNSTRIGLLVRVLFLANNFPRMQVGSGHLPDYVAAAMPLYPLTLNQDVPLLADPGFDLSGKAEDPLVQIQFCEQQCTFRSAPLAPTANLSTVARQIPSISAEPRNISLLQAQLLRLAKDVCAAPASDSQSLSVRPETSRMLDNCMSIFQRGGVVWDPVRNAYKRR